MNTEFSQKENLLYRTMLALAMILLVAALRIAPHPWNFTPVGAMALFSGALLKDRRLAFLFPLVALFVGDVFIGFHKLLPIVYASFLINVAIGLWLRDRRSIARIGMTALFPIWKRDTRELIRCFHEHRFRAIAACIDTKVLDPSFAGRELDESFFRDLPPHADPCGENGEFHTFVFDGPLFQSPIPVRTGEVVNRDGFVFCDLLPQPCNSPRNLSRPGRER